MIAREYYNLTADPAENTNLLGDANTANDPPAATSPSHQPTQRLRHLHWRRLRPIEAVGTVRAD